MSKKTDCELSHSKKVAPGPLRATLQVPTSKSVANRLLILAAVFPGEWIIKNCSDSTDVKTMIACLKKIGLEIETDGQDLRVIGSFPACEVPTSNPVELETGDGGTTNRFLAALLARGRNRYSLKPSEKMTERPMEELIEVLKSLQVDASRDANGVLHIKGPMVLTPTVNVDCSRSTQFATGLALALSDTDTRVIPLRMENSEKYFTMTRTLIERARKGIRSHLVTADGSGVGYPLAMACFGGDVMLSNVHEVDPDQADFAIVELLKQMKANINWTPNGLRLIGDQALQAFKADASVYPDLMLTLAFLAAYAEGTSTFVKLEVLKHKESDRLAEILRLLVEFQVMHEYKPVEDVLLIHGPAPQTGQRQIVPPVDHRVVMVAYLFLRKNSGGMLMNTHAVEKSFANFFQVMEST